MPAQRWNTASQGSPSAGSEMVYGLDLLFHLSCPHAQIRPWAGLPFYSISNSDFLSNAFWRVYSQMFKDISMDEDAHVCSVALLMCGSPQNWKKLKKKPS